MIDSFPREILIYLLGFLSGKDLARIAQVNSFFRQVTNDQNLWRTVCNKEFYHFSSTNDNWRNTYIELICMSWDDRCASVHLKLSNKNLTVTKVNQSQYGIAQTTVPFLDGTHYWEVHVNQFGFYDKDRADQFSDSMGIGVARKLSSSERTWCMWRFSQSWSWVMDGSLYVMGKHSGHYPKYFSGDRIGILLEMNAQEKKFNITFFKNGEKMLDTKLKAFVPVTGEIPPEGLYPTATLTYNTAQVTAKFNAMPPPEE